MLTFPCALPALAHSTPLLLVHIGSRGSGRYKPGLCPDMSYELYQMQRMIIMRMHVATVLRMISNVLGSFELRRAVPARCRDLAAIRREGDAHSKCGLPG